MKEGEEIKKDSLNKMIANNQAIIIICGQVTDNRCNIQQPLGNTYNKHATNGKSLQ